MPSSQKTMEADLEPPIPTTATATTTTVDHHFLSPPSPSPMDFDDNDDYDNFYINDSTSSTPFVSAPSSPGRPHFPAISGFFYSAPASPMHYVLSASTSGGAALAPTTSDASSGSFEFEFSARFDSPAPEIGPPPMSSADELFLNGQIRPMKLSAHLERPQALAPLIDLDGNNDDDDDDDDNGDVFQRSRDLRSRNRSLRRRTRSLSPLRSMTPFDWLYSDDVVASTPKKTEERENDEIGNGGGGEKGEEERENGSGATAASGSASSSRCSSAGRSSKRWVFLKDFLRSKSEGTGRSSNNKFWHNISFSPAKERKERESRGSSNNGGSAASFLMAEKEKMMRMRKANGKEGAAPAKKSPPSAAAMGAAKRRSAHEMHYTANRAQAEEMRKKTFLPYRQGLLGCLGFNSKSYGAINGFARALNPVSSR